MGESSHLSKGYLKNKRTLYGGWKIESWTIIAGKNPIDLQENAKIKMKYFNFIFNF